MRNKLDLRVHNAKLLTKIITNLTMLTNLTPMSHPILKMWWLIGSAPDFWGRGPGFEFSISYNDPDALYRIIV